MVTKLVIIVKLVSAKCPSCGGKLNINENSKVIKCEYCDTNIIVEDDTLRIQSNQNKKYNYFVPKKKISIKKKIIMIVLTLLLFILNVVAMKISWDYENSLGSVAFFLSGLLFLYGIRNSELDYNILFKINILGVVLFIGALWFSLYIYNLIPGYVNEWENDNILLIIDRKEATIEFKDSGKKENDKYSTYYESKYINGKFIQYKRIKIAEYNFLYSEEEKTMCYANDKNECIEDLKLVKE